MFKLTLAFIHVLLLASSSVGESFVGVQDTDYGTDVFIGVPYASHPVRLQAPVALSGDQGVVLANKPSSNHCFEIGTGASTVGGSEDCLTLDIIRPSIGKGSKGSPVVVQADPKFPAPKKLLPVYVFFHGGDFNSGDKSAYDGRNLVKTSNGLGSPIIYIAVNYRLGFLGFPAGKEAESHAATNLGLLDSRLSLKWLQQYITYFGGDPKKVTIGGQGSGADIVAYHLLANGGKCDGLFRGAILHSGSATGRSPIPPANYTGYQNHYDAITSATGCNASSDTWTCLQNAPIDSLIQASRKVFADTKLANPASVFSPVVDGTFLADFPSTLMQQGKFAHVPVLIGTTRSELVNSVPIYSGFGTNASIFAYLKSLFPYVSDNTLQTLLFYYPISDFQNIGPPLSGAMWSRVVALINDLEMFCAVKSQALQVSKVANVFKYRFNAVLQSAPVKTWEGVPQGSDLRYVFPIGGANMSQQSAADLALMTKFQSAIISFINELDPNWKKFDSSSRNTFVFERPNTPAVVDRTAGETVCAFIEEHNLEFLR